MGVYSMMSDLFQLIRKTSRPSLSISTSLLSHISYTSRWKLPHHRDTPILASSLLTTNSSKGHISPTLPQTQQLPRSAHLFKPLAIKFEAHFSSWLIIILYFPLPTPTQPWKPSRMRGCGSVLCVAKLSAARKKFVQFFSLLTLAIAWDWPLGVCWV